MTNYNLHNANPPLVNYSSGLLPQRNRSNLWYQDTSCRSNLARFSLSSENRRILKKTQSLTFITQSLPLRPPKIIFDWTKSLGWDFPVHSIKTVFTDHLFNRLYVWFEDNKTICAYSICYFSPPISHIAYVFYRPVYYRGNLPLRLVLQVVIDSYRQSLQYCYLGRDHTSPASYYKRNMPGYEYFKQGKWVKYK